MAEEYFDVVDENDRVTGRATRRDAHARGLLHRAIHVMIFGSRGRILLQRRSWRKDVAPGVWDSSCSGHVDSGEDYDPAAVRELAEELGLAEAAPPPRWFRVPACGETGGEFVWVYRLARDGPFSPNPEEIDLCEWWEPAEVDSRIRRHPAEFSPAFRFLWAEARARLGREARPDQAER